MGTNDGTNANTSDDPLIFCEISSPLLENRIRLEDVRQSDCNSYRRQISRVSRGGFLLTIPDAMFWKTTTTVTLVMAQESNEEVLTPTDADENGGRVIRDDIAISRFMFAEMVDPANAFTITSNSQRVRDFEIDPTPSWEWNLAANTLGKHNVTVRLGFQLTDAQGNRSRYFPIKRQTITVSPTLMQRIELFFHDLSRVFVAPQDAIEELIILLGLIGSLGAAYWAMRKKWKKPDSDAASDSATAAGSV